MLKVLLMTVFFASCSSQQQQEELPPENSASANETLNASADQSSEQLGASANNSAKNDLANGAKNPATNGVPVSNPSGNLGMTNPGAGQNMFGGNAPAGIPANATANTSALSSEGTDNANGNGTNNAAEGAKPTIEGKEYTNPHMNWPGRGRVKYARGKSARHSAPNGPVVGQYEKGDHPLVMKEGEWSELSDGTFMPSSDLSEQGIGRDKQ